MFSPPAHTQEATTDAPDPGIEALLQELRSAKPEEAGRIEQRVMNAWSKSGSAAMDLLLKRGRDAIEVRKYDVALDHLTALTDHAPDFAEGWHALALSYYNLELFGPAADALERTLALNPQHFGAMRGLGAILERVDEREKAYQVYLKALEVHPNDKDVLDAIERLDGKVGGTAL